MFENKQDTSLLRHSLLSAAKLNGGSLFNHCDIETAINTITNSVKTIVLHNLDGVKDEKEIVKMQLNVNQRLHAAVYFVSLSSNGITSSAANTFYDSISFAWPMIDFKFYIELNFKNQWSEYFIRCASQLPSEVLILLLKNIFNISFSRQVKYYSWHLIFQTVILKLLKVSVDNENECPFNFDFTSEATPLLKEKPDSTLSEQQSEKVADVSNLVHDKSCDNISSFEDLFNVLYESLCADIQQSHDIDAIKILLNAVKLLVKYKEVICDKNIIKICNLLGNCLCLNTNLEVLKTALNSYTYGFINHVYATAAWNVSENYLLLIINHYYSALSQEEVLNLKNKLECTETNKFFPVILQDLIPFSKDNFHVHNKKHLELLYSVIQLKFEGAAYASKILVSNHILLQLDSTLKILEDIGHVIDVIDVYPLLLENILKVDCELKVKLLKFFFKILSENSIKIYNDVLKYILLFYGFTEKFQLPDFEDQLSLFVRRTSAMKEIESVLPSLFLQSPRTTLECIIEEVLNQGPEGEPLIQALKFVPEACTYQRTCEDTTPLIEILQDYLENETLEAYVSKNFATLFQFLMDVHVETPILFVNQFLEKCIIPYLKSSNKIELVLQCLNVIVKKLVDKEVTLNEKHLSSSESSELLLNREFDISDNNLKSLIYVLAQVADTCIETGSGRLKELATSALGILEEYQMHSGILNDEDKVELQSYFGLFDEVVQIYGKKFLPSTLEFKNPSSYWIWACRTKNIADFEEKYTNESLTYVDLLNMLVQLMPHLTVDEWKFSIDLAEALCKNSSLRENIIQCSVIPFQLSECESNLYAIISCFITSLHFAIQGRISESMHTCTCFCNSLKKLLKEDLTSQILLTVFLELCCFMNCITPSLFSVFSSVLFELKDRLLLCADKSSSIVYQKLIFHAVKCLPDSPEKNVLSQKMKIFV